MHPFLYKCQFDTFIYISFFFAFIFEKNIKKIYGKKEFAKQSPNKFSCRNRSVIFNIIYLLLRKKQQKKEREKYR